MPVPASFSDLSETPSANSPLGTENVGTIMNQYIQQAYAFIKMLYDGQAATPYVPLAGNVTITGPLTMPSVTANTPDASGAGGQFRAISGNYGVMLRNDGSSCYLMQTASGAQTAAPNAYRPFAWNLSTGVVTIDGTANGTSFGGAVTVYGGQTVNGGQTVSGLLAVNSASAQTGVTVTSTGGSVYERFVNSGGSKYIGSVGNNFVVVNNANTAVLLTIDESGNLTATGNITSSSDEKKKKDWASMRGDFLESMASVLRGTYTDIASGERRAGVGAGSLKDVFPEVVVEGSDGYLSAAYGQAALVLALELNDEVLRLRALLEPTK